ncbi:MAG TPA: glycosyltransferase, partial [Methanobacterium sp.]|nr:glycosyltransferase [Methanobacterium sp.]
ERILNEKYGVQNAHTIYNMMDIQDNIKMSQEELPHEYKELLDSYDKEHFDFINLGRLNKQKGQWFLIRCFRRVVDKHPHSQLIILGEGDLRIKLEDLVSKLDLDENIHLIGEQKNIFPFLKNSQCFVLSSLWEGLPMALIEALSMNLPTISTDCKTGPREILCPELELEEVVDYPYLGEYAVLNESFPNKEIFEDLDEVPLIKSEEKLADLMIRMIEDNQFKRNYINGLDLALKFDNKKILKQWMKLIENLKQ